MGAQNQSTHSHSHRFVFNSINSTAKLESQVDKDVALHWYRKWASFKNTSPDMTYAQAVLKNKTKKCFIHRDKQNLLAFAPVKNAKIKSSPNPVNVNTGTDKVVYGARKTRILHNKENVPVPLLNRFTVLADVSDENNACINQSISRGSSGYNTELNNTNASRRSSQHSSECKYPSSLAPLQPSLVVQANSLSQGNKNKTGSFDRDLGAKTDSDSCTVTHLSDSSVTTCGTSQVVTNSSQLTQDRGIVYQPQLAVTKQTFLGNKNKTGHSNGDVLNANVLQHCNIQGENHGDVIDIMDTEIFDQEVYQNCNLNTTCDQSHVQNLSCDTVDTKVQPQFGFIPKGQLKLYDGDPGLCNRIPDIINAHLLIRHSGLPNYLGCRIPIASNIKYDIWAQYLEEYWDKQLPDLLKFGFPLDFDCSCSLYPTEENHKSAILNADHVNKYIVEELHHEAILGPFSDKPIQLHTSPLMVRDKQDSDSKRTIMDLSWPEGHSVNFGVSKDVYLGTEFVLKYPSLDSITRSIRKLGPAAMMYKIDISRAFRQIKVDPGDIDLLGFKVNNQYFLDLSFAFGYRNGSQIFQRCTDAIRYIMSQHGFHNLHNYIDDLIYTGLPSEIHMPF